jgi:membrane protease YdiL (CAAX protease family)
VRVSQQPAAFHPSVGDQRRWRQQGFGYVGRAAVEGAGAEYVQTMAAQSPSEGGPTPVPGQPRPAPEPPTGGQRPELLWPSEATGRDDPPWPTEAPWAPAESSAPSGGFPIYGSQGPTNGSHGSLPSQPGRSRGVPGRGPSIPARAAWCAVPGLLAGYALAIVGATIGDALSGSATGPVTTLLSEMGLWAGMLGTVIFVSRRFGSASLRRDFGLEIRAPDVLWGFAAVAAALIVSEIVVVVFAGTKFAGSNDQIISQQKGHEVGLVILTLIVELGAPFFEELFFRGFLRTALQERFGAGGAVWLQAAFFGFAHVGESKTAAGNVTVVLALFLVGVVLGYTAKLTGRLGAGMLAHCLFNLVAVASVL